MKHEIIYAGNVTSAVAYTKLLEAVSKRVDCCSFCEENYLLVPYIT